MSFQVMGTSFKRKFPRRQFHRSIGFLFNGNYLVGSGSEIGEGGLSLLVPSNHPIEKEAVLSFQIPNGSFICVRVEIRNAVKDKKNGFFILGCAYKNLTFEHKREIRSYVSARSEQEQIQ
jgi:hypothetical protein